MLEDFKPNRYSVIEDKNKREIVMLIGTGCTWRRCRFCDYHLDYDASEDVCYTLNHSILKNVTGLYGKLEIINSGSFTELDNKTIQCIEDIALQKNIKELHFECHYMNRHAIKDFRQRFAKNNIQLKIKCGVETFDATYRENILNKGIGNASPKEISLYFDEVCLLFGLDGQTETSMRNDITIGLQFFERICINIMQENGCLVKPNQNIIKQFIDNIYPEFKSNARVDILLENTAFGVGGVTT